MKTILKEVKCLNRNDIPKKGETIADDFHLEKLVPNVLEMNVYIRDEDECPFHRGNWMIDIDLIDGTTFAIKLPKEMAEEDVKNFIKPLVDLLEEHKKSFLH